MRDRGVWMVLGEACSLMVSTLTACRDTMRWRAPFWTGVVGVRVPRGGWTRVLRCSCLGVSGSMMHGGVVIPGVLFRVTRRWSLGVVRSALLDVGLRVSMIGGACEMRGTVVIGFSVITL